MSNDKGRLLPQALMDAQICPRCGGSVQQRRVRDLVCQACQTEYPVKDGIVLLYGDYGAITRNIKGGHLHKKDWYVADPIRFDPQTKVATNTILRNKVHGLEAFPFKIKEKREI